MPDAIESLLTAALGRATVLRRLPVSTYRLQFHKGFTFADATRILPYLAELGITHVYASPYLAATPGSTHGYDVIDHCRLNPELGTDADYDAFLAALKLNGLTHILDTVPNHVGVATNDNTWWNDVLEHGPASRYAGYFDITWDSNARPELKDKVLLPTLGKTYGQALDDGELTLSFDADAGRFWVNYFQRRFPLDPESYARILSRGGDADGKLRGLIHSSETLDASTNAEARLRNCDAVKTGLAALVGGDTAVRQHVEAAVASFNGTPGEPNTFDALDRLLDAQNFRLADWHVAFDEINYRRFFDVNDLAALAMERPEVFEATHSLILPKLARGEIAGLRIDHPDGLFDPAAYFLRLQREYVLAIAKTIHHEKDVSSDWPSVEGRLRERLQSYTGSGDGPQRWPLFVSAEKILALDEPLIEDWAVHGTSGYDYLVRLNALFVDPAAEPAFDTLWHDVTGDTTPYAELAYRNKRQMLETSLASELHTLTWRLDRLARKHRRSVDFTFRALQIAIRETVACFGVYRTYVQGTHVTDLDRRRTDEAINKAKHKNPLTPAAVFDFLRDAVLQDYAPNADAVEKHDVQQFAGKFQQLTSPVTAKGIEDTTFYQYNRFLSLNEVGGEPAEFGLEPERFHQYLADRQTHWPYALSALSTHDTKRSEDVRARLDVLSDVPDAWASAVRGWFDAHQTLRTTHDDGQVSPGPDEEYLIYQTLLGAWPLDGNADADFADRIQAYTLKAIREAKRRTRWGEPNPPHEDAVTRFISSLLDRPRSADFYQTFDPLLKTASHFGLINSLAQTLIKLTSPGVPDTYQGTELWDFSLVDPDNRRPVDYAVRERMLNDHDADPSVVSSSMTDGRVKLHLTAVALRLRRQHADLFTRGDYRPLTARGAKADHVFGFTRTLGQQAIAVVVPLRTARLVKSQNGLPVGPVWDDTAVDLSTSDGWTDVLTDTPLTSSRVADVFTRLPVALLFKA